MIYTCTCPYIHKRCVHRRQRCGRANSLNKASGGGGLSEKGYTKLCNYHACAARQRNPSGHCLLMCSYISSACQTVQSGQYVLFVQRLSRQWHFAMRLPDMSANGSQRITVQTRSGGRHKKAKQDNHANWSFKKTDTTRGERDVQILALFFHLTPRTVTPIIIPC